MLCADRRPGDPKQFPHTVGSSWEGTFTFPLLNDRSGDSIFHVIIIRVIIVLIEDDGMISNKNIVLYGELTLCCLVRFVYFYLTIF